METQNHPRTKRARLDTFLREAFEDKQSRLYGKVNNLLVLVILYSVVTIILESVDAVQTAYSTFFTISEAVVLLIFAFEYFANLYVSKPRRAYVLSLWGILDLLAIIPSVLTFLPLRQLKVARILRVLRFLRLLRLLKLAKKVAVESGTSKRYKYGTFGLDIQIYAITMFAILVISSTLIYFFENTSQPELYKDIPTAMWWAIVTMTTVGYGDFYPVTLGGRLVAAVTALLGLAMFALLTSVLGKVMMRGLFGSETGAQDEDEAAATVAFSIPDQIKQVAILRDEGVLSEHEFHLKKKELLDLM